MDSLRGIATIMIILHHWRCTFYPCAVFGPTAEWVGDPTECTSTQSTWSLAWIVNACTNGSLAIAFAFTISGFLLSNSLWKSPLSVWRIAVVKRYIRLVCPVGVSLVLSYLAAASSTITAVAVAEVTNSQWLVRMAPVRPSPITGLISQVIWGVWRDDITRLNAAALWAMKYAWEGSLLTFAIVPLTKRLTPRFRSYCLGAIFVLCLCAWPSYTTTSPPSVHVVYEKYTPIPNQLPGEKRITKTVPVRVALDPIRHAPTLRHIQDLLDASANEAGSIPVSFFNQVPAKNLSALRLDEHPDTVSIYDDLLKAAAAGLNRNSSYSTPRIEVFQPVESSSSTATSTNYWLWHAAFVAGMWISNERFMSGPRYATNHQAYSFLALAFALVCASYPRTPWWVHASPIWRIQQSIAQALFGYAASDPIIQSLWSILGAATIVWQVVTSRWCRSHLAAQSTLAYIGRELSFSLFLLHIPVLYFATCTLFLRYYHGDLYHDDKIGSSVWACGWSIPLLWGTAFCMAQAVDIPAAIASGPLAEWLLLGSQKQGGTTSSTGAKEALGWGDSQQGSSSGVPLPAMDETERSEEASESHNT